MSNHKQTEKIKAAYNQPAKNNVAQKSGDVKIKSSETSKLKAEVNCRNELAPNGQVLLQFGHLKLVTPGLLLIPELLLMIYS